MHKECTNALVDHQLRLSIPWRTLRLVRQWLPLQPIRFVPTGTSSTAFFITRASTEGLPTTLKIINDDFAATYKETAAGAILTVDDAIGGQPANSLYKYVFIELTKPDGSSTAPETINFVASTGLQPVGTLDAPGVSMPRFLSYDAVYESDSLGSAVVITGVVFVEQDDGLVLREIGVGRIEN